MFLLIKKLLTVYISATGTVIHADEDDFNNCVFLVKFKILGITFTGLVPIDVVEKTLRESKITFSKRKEIVKERLDKEVNGVSF